MPPDRTVRIVVGLATALVLAGILSQPRIKSLTRRLTASEFLSSGLLFLLLGAVFSLPAVGIVNEQLLLDSRPLIDFGLAWIGFSVGLLVNVRKRPTSRVVDVVSGFEWLAPVVLTSAAAGLAFLAFGVPVAHGEWMRDAALLAACTAPSAAVGATRLGTRFGRGAAAFVERACVVDDLVALLLLAAIATAFPTGGTAAYGFLVRSLWTLFSLGLGAGVGAVAYVLLRVVGGTAPGLALLLVVVALTAGLAHLVGTPVLAMSAAGGVVLGNLRHEDIGGLRRTFADLERPLNYLFLMIAGAIWHPGDVRGLVLALVFVASRTVAKRLGAAGLRREMPESPPAFSVALSLMPASPVAAAMVVAASFMVSGARPEVAGWLTTAVIGGVLLTEAGTRLAERMDRAALDAVDALERTGSVP